ncbi:hypothetical protein BH10PSE1_BH10PSE1_10740 [soil metagenome]
MIPADVTATVESNEHLLKAVIALLTIRDPDFLRQLDRVFALADAHDSKIGRMTPEAWAEIRREMTVVRDFVQGEDESMPVSQSEIKIAH